MATASGDDSTSARYLASPDLQLLVGLPQFRRPFVNPLLQLVADLCNAASACFRAVMSVVNPSMASSSPAAEKTPVPCSQTHFCSPVTVERRYSTWYCRF